MARYSKAKINAANSRLRTAQRKFEADMRRIQSNARTSTNRLIQEERKLRDALNRLS